MPCNTVLFAEAPTPLLQPHYIVCMHSEALPAMLRVCAAPDLDKLLRDLPPPLPGQPFKLAAYTMTLNPERDLRRINARFRSRHVSGYYYSLAPAEIQSFLDTHIYVQFLNEYGVLYDLFACGASDLSSHHIWV